MTDVPAACSQAAYNREKPPENGQHSISTIHEEITDGTSSLYCRIEPSLQELPAEGNQDESGKLQGNVLFNSSVDGKTPNDISLQETSDDEMAFREGHQWEKIPLSSSNQEISIQEERIMERPWEEREDEARKIKAYEATEIEWLGSQKPGQVDMLHSKHDQEQEVWDEEINNDDDDCNDDEDEVRVIEFKKKYEEGFQFEKEDDAREYSPLCSPSSQPVTPDEQPTLGKKNDISRNTYSRYNTISYRKIRKGNTKQRIDEFESMMHL
ncbi:ermin isoform X2 [Ochotona princeps]|uniref:ermin isoform X2 n=1 Tax=Ochotona princeps TaxID=9978 RepID=UPI002714A845|nr:ermin isoform X2 [Ochotona princeps]